MRIVIPVKPLDRAKTRLAGTLTLDERRRLMIALLDLGLSAALAVAAVSVVTADETVARIAREAGADVITEGRELGLNAAARLAAARLRAMGETAMLILAADLPDVTAAALGAMAAQYRKGAVVIAPSGDGGTNALALAPGDRFDFAYGPGSYELHRRGALSAGLEVAVCPAPELRLDLDRPEDLTGREALWAA